MESTANSKIFLNRIILMKTCICFVMTFGSEYIMCNFPIATVYDHVDGNVKTVVSSISVQNNLASILRVSISFNAWLGV